MDEAAILVIAMIVGLSIGSFLNVVMFRVPRHESVSYPASHCPGCDTPLRSYELIPVVSWVALRGHCRTCHIAISARYPLVELASGVAFGIAAWLVVA